MTQWHVVLATREIRIASPNGLSFRLLENGWCDSFQWSCRLCPDDEVRQALYAACFHAAKQAAGALRAETGLQYRRFGSAKSDLRRELCERVATILNGTQTDRADASLQQEIQ